MWRCKVKYIIGCIAIGLMTIPVASFADRDVFVDGYYRSDGTYVRPHVRKSPDNSLSNNYGPSQHDRELMNPRSRDYDRDGTSNYRDNDDDNDGVKDDRDSYQYNGSRW